MFREDVNVRIHWEVSVSTFDHLLSRQSSNWPSQLVLSVYHVICDNTVHSPESVTLDTPMGFSLAKERGNGCSTEQWSIIFFCELNSCCKMFLILRILHNNVYQIVGKRYFSFWIWVSFLFKINYYGFFQNKCSIN